MSRHVRVSHLHDELLFNFMVGLIYSGTDNISCQSVMHVQFWMWLTKFQVHVHIQVHASRAAAGTRVPVGYYPCNFLLPEYSAG